MLKCFTGDYSIPPPDMDFGRFTGDTVGRTRIVCIFVQCNVGIALNDLAIYFKNCCIITCPRKIELTGE